MNELGREKLREAALAGIKQIRGHYTSPSGGRCAMGVLLYWAGVENGDRYTLLRRYGIRDVGPSVQCPLCELKSTTEFDLILHLNDYHECDFLKIAELAP